MSTIRTKGTAAALLVATVTVGAGCWTTKQQGAALRRDVDKLKEQLRRDIKQSEQERVKLKKIMEQATALLTRNSADVGAQVERIQVKVDRIAGETEEIRKDVHDLSVKVKDLQDQIDKVAQGAAPPGPDEAPQDKAGLFKSAKAKLAAGEHQQARRLLRHYVNSFPDDSRVPQVQLMLGDSYYAQQKFAPAIVEYKKIVENHTGSSAFPDALFKIGMAFYQLKFCNDAQGFFKQLLKRHPRHSEAKRARKVLRLIRRYRRNPKICRP